MQIAALKCWEERTLSEFPPLIINSVAKYNKNINSNNTRKQT